jgi:AcrR family transcriptional regulator
MSRKGVIELDRRVRKTQDSVHTAMAKLLQVKPLSQITVKELCAEADINKSTFYLHYQIIYDCASGMYNSIIKKMTDLLEQYNREEQRYKLPEILKSAMGIYTENRTIYEPFLKSASLASVVYGIRQQVVRAACALGSQQQQRDPLYRCGIAFLVSGLIGVLEQCDYDEINDEVIKGIGEGIQNEFLARFDKPESCR